MGEAINSVLDFLKHYTLIQSLLYIGGIFLILLIFVVITKPSIRFLNFSLSFFGKRNNLPVFLQFKQEMEKKIYFIEYIGITKAQMKKVDFMLQRVKEMLMDNYASLISVTLSDQEVTTHTEYLSYSAMVEVMLFIRIRDKVRELVLDDATSIPDIASENFEIYSKNTAISWYDTGKSYMDLFYGKGHVITREELREANYKLMPEYERCTREVLRDIKNVQIEMKNEIERLKEQIRAREKAVLGITLT
jgi:hypothetical protein